MLKLLCNGDHLGFEWEHPMTIYIQFGFNQFYNFWEFFFSFSNRVLPMLKLCPAVAAFLDFWLTQKHTFCKRPSMAHSRCVCCQTGSAVSDMNYFFKHFSLLDTQTKFCKEPSIDYSSTIWVKSYFLFMRKYLVSHFPILCPLLKFVLQWWASSMFDRLRNTQPF